MLCLVHKKGAPLGHIQPGIHCKSQVLFSRAAAWPLLMLQRKTHFGCTSVFSTQLPNSVVMLYTYHSEIVISACWASLMFINWGASGGGWEEDCCPSESAGSKTHMGSLLHPTAWHAEAQTYQYCQHHAEVARDGDLLCTHFNLHYWEDWCYLGWMWSVPEGAGTWLKAERMENVCCCFCLTLGTDPAEIITEEFTLPCQICRYFAVLRFDALFL